MPIVEIEKGKKKLVRGCIKIKKYPKGLKRAIQTLVPPPYNPDNHFEGDLPDLEKNKNSTKPSLNVYSGKKPSISSMKNRKLRDPRLNSRPR